MGSASIGLVLLEVTGIALAHGTTRLNSSLLEYWQQWTFVFIYALIFVLAGLSLGKFN